MVSYGFILFLRRWFLLSMNRWFSWLFQDYRNSSPFQNQMGYNAEPLKRKLFSSNIQRYFFVTFVFSLKNNRQTQEVLRNSGAILIPSCLQYNRTDKVGLIFIQLHKWVLHISLNTLINMTHVLSTQ